MIDRARLTRPVLVASVSAAALLGSAALPALAAPSATPSSAPSTPATSSTPAKPSTPSASSAPTATPSRTAQTRALQGSVTPPGSSTGAASGHFTAAPGQKITLTVGEPNGHQPTHVVSGVADAKGNIGLTLAAPNGKWPSGATFHWVASDGSESQTGAFTVPKWSGHEGSIAASVTAPSGATAPVSVVVTGAEPGTKVTVVVTVRQGFIGEGGGRATGTADKSGRVVVGVPAPAGGWVAGSTYGVSATDSAGHGVLGHTLSSFTMPARPNTSAARSSMVIDLKVAPRGAHDPVVFSMSGLQKDQWVTVVGFPDGWKQEAPYIEEVRATGDSPQEVRFDAPTAGWPLGVEYRFTFTGHDDEVQTRSFVVRSGARDNTKDDGGAAPSAGKESTGGLPKTGR